MAVDGDVIAELRAEIDRLQRQIAASTVPDLRYRYGVHRRSLILCCDDHGVVESWRGLVHRREMAAAEARHDAEKHAGDPPPGAAEGLPARDLVQALGVLEGCVVTTVGHPVGGGVDG